MRRLIEVLVEEEDRPEVEVVCEGEEGGALASSWLMMSV